MIRSGKAATHSIVEVSYANVLVSSSPQRIVRELLRFRLVSDRTTRHVLDVLLPR
jgi:hypothetical protein